MLSFLQTKAYRKTFLGYLIILLVICGVGGLFLYQNSKRHLIENHENLSMITYNRFDRSLNKLTTIVDEYMNRLYTQPKLWKDFECFFGNSPEVYLTKRLYESRFDKEIISFTEDIHNYILSNNDFVDRIYIQSPNLTSVMLFQANEGTTIQYIYNTPENIDINVDLEDGYVYTKNLPDPNNNQVVKGKLIFVIDSHNVYEEVKDYEQGYAMFSNSQGSYFFGSPMSDKLKESLNLIFNSKKVNGMYSLELFNQFYYNIYTSSDHGYQLLMGVDTDFLREENKKNNRYIFIGCVAVYLFLIGFVTVRTERDARYVKKILSSIHSAKSGDFISINASSRQDEYGVIARELNDMSYQLNHYIKNEYLLEIKQKETQMEALIYQINPHFLYNTLEIIKASAIVNHDTEVAEAVAALGNMYRNLVKEEKIITIERELLLLGYYLKLLEFKYSGDFSYQIDVEENLLTVETVKFFMQPLVENFLVHGYNKESEFNLVIIQGREEALEYVFRIIDNGLGCDKEKIDQINEELKSKIKNPHHIGVGLENVLTRLEFFYLGRVTVQLKANDPQGLITEVRILK